MLSMLWINTTNQAPRLGGGWGCVYTLTLLRHWGVLKGDTIRMFGSKMKIPVLHQSRFGPKCSRQIAFLKQSRGNYNFMNVCNWHFCASCARNNITNWSMHSSYLINVFWHKAMWLICAFRHYHSTSGVGSTSLINPKCLWDHNNSVVQHLTDTD